MFISPGTRIGPYEVVAKIGEGGMGEVYRARDTRLNRDVALKVLPEIFASDPERRARFTREAQLLASLNHPHIAGIYGVEDSDRGIALVLEFVDGPTLADRIAQGPLAIDDAVDIARQLMEALEAAHERGVIHRDLKPANIKLTSGRKTKVLDFGLAKLLEAPGQDVYGAELTNSPTRVPQGLPAGGSPATTQHGMILGTAAYMSPEQAKGRPADTRSDIWAFGCVMFEMLTGRAPFAGETVTEVLANVIHKEPSWETLPADTPGSVRQLIRRCLAKDPARRLRDIGDARFALEDVSDDGAHDATTERPHARAGVLRTASAFVAGLVVAGAVAGAMLTRRTAGREAIDRWTISLPAEAPIDLSAPWSGVAISRDGRAVLYTARTSAGRQLFLRRADDLTPHAVGGTQDVWEAFFSPDGQWIGFIAADRLKKVAITGGQPVTIADTPNFASGVWAADGSIYLGGRAGLAKVSPEGRLTRLLNPSPDEGRLIDPDLLPDGSLLFTIHPNNVASFDDARIAVLTPKGERRIVLEGGAYARYAPTGHIVYARGGEIMAVAFDAKRLVVTGTPVPVVAGGAFSPLAGEAFFALSESGVLVYAPGGPNLMERSLAWIDRRGTLSPIAAPAHSYAEPTFSRDGQQIALTLRAANDDIWTYDVARGAFSRLTFPRGNSDVSLFSPDGRRVVYAVDRQGVRNLVWRATDGSGAEEPLTPAEYFQTPGSWSPDGKVLAYTEDRPDTASDIMLLRMDGDRKPVPFLSTSVNERWPTFSPDGHWIAYMSDETGRFEIFLTSYPGPGRKWQVSQGGGGTPAVGPAWRIDGREIVYRANNSMMSVAVDGQTLGEPHELFKLPADADYITMSPDAQRFFVIYRNGRDEYGHQIDVVVNWLSELQQRVPAK